MNGLWRRWITCGCGLGLFLMSATGCSSTEDRVKSVIEQELEECKASEDRFYEVETRDGDTYEVLSELCHLEPSEVTMNDEWTGRLTTGPAKWTAAKDESRSGAVVITRVAWPELERALSAVNATGAEAEHFERAEEHFAKALDEYDGSAWVRQQRLDNLLALRAEDMSVDDDESLVGDAAEAYIEEYMQWAEDDAEIRARVQLAAIKHVEGYLKRQQNIKERLGTGDDRREARIDHAEDEGDTELAEELRQELEEIREGRPAEKERIEERVTLAEQQLCEYTTGLNVDSIEDNSLRSQVTAAMGLSDCQFDDEEEVAADE